MQSYHIHSFVSGFILNSRLRDIYKYLLPVYKFPFLVGFTFLSSRINREGEFPFGISLTSLWRALIMAFYRRRSCRCCRWIIPSGLTCSPGSCLLVAPASRAVSPVRPSGLFIWFMLQAPAQRAAPASSEAPCDWYINIHMGFPRDGWMFAASDSSSLHCESILNCLGVTIADLLCSLKKRTPGRQVGVS